MINIVPTTGAHVRKMAGKDPPHRIRAWTGIKDDEILGIGGIAYLPDGAAVAFAELTEKARKHPVALHKAARMILRECKRLKIHQLVATATPGVKAAGPWLERLGFKPNQIDGQTVYVWHSGND